jgi:hypothetical protein
MMQIKKFFKPADKSEKVSGQNDPNFHNEPKFTSPVTRAMKKTAGATKFDKLGNQHSL